jgi:hypothetical protein
VNALNQALLLALLLTGVADAMYCPSLLLREPIVIQRSHFPFSKKIAFTQGRFRIQGSSIAAPYSFLIQGYCPVQYVITHTFRTREGLTFYTVQRELSPNEKRALSHFSNVSTVWRHALLYPNWLNAYGFYADRTTLVAPTLTTLNSLLDKQTQSDFEVGPRFIEIPFDGPLEAHHYTPETFFDFLKEGKIPMATVGELAFHDQQQEHMVGALLTPPALYLRLVHFAKRVEFLSKQAVIQTYFASELSLSRTSFSPFWDRFSGSLGFSFPTKFQNYDGEWAVRSERRKLLHTLLAGISIDKSTAEAVHRIDPDIYVYFQNLQITQTLRRQLHSVPRAVRAKIKALLFEAETLFPAPVADVSELEKVFLRRLGRHEPDVNSLNLLQP